MQQGQAEVVAWSLWNDLEQLNATDRPEHIFVVKDAMQCSTFEPLKHSFCAADESFWLTESKRILIPT
jgi:hypothetical protein